MIITIGIALVIVMGAVLGLVWICLRAADAL